MQNLSTAWLLWAALASLGCEGAPGDSAPVDPFLGRWSCGETRTLTFSTPVGSPDATTQTRFVLNVAVADGQITMYATSEAGVPCQLKFTESGTTATLMTGQSCMTPDGIQLDYKMGTADLTAAGLQTSLTFDFSGSPAGADGGASPASAGSGTTTSVCTKVYGSGGGGSPGGGGW